jgi:sterol desaturase/sphingolipid hydroxylase (fatty acid hydroxylase superfamily)
MFIAYSGGGAVTQTFLSIAITTAESFVFYSGVYLLMAGVPYLVFWRWKKATFSHKRIQQKTARKPKVGKEIGLSLLTLLTFSVMLGVLFELPRWGITQIYFTIADYGWLWFVASIVLMAIIHDTYYYWAHRWMHTRWLFRHVHRVHHQFTNPSPFAAYAFHPGEIVIEIAVFGILVFILPLNPLAIAAYITILTYLNVISHLGFELYTSKLLHRWVITSTHHNMHHSRINGNYMLYFNFWDWLMGTNHNDYEQVYAQLADAEPETHPSAPVARYTNFHKS